MIEGRVIVITGASNGIGKAVALLLAARGAKVVLGAREESGLKSLSEEINESGGESAWLAIDVARREDVVALVSLATRRYGKLDVIHSNAGVMPVGPLDELAVDDWEQMVDVNIKGVLWGIAAALPVFRRQRFGHFIHTASTAARKTVTTQAVYSGTKAAVLAISEGLRQEVAGQLRVTVITPGMTDTGVVGHVKSPEARARMEEARTKIAMPPAAVARAVAFAIDQPDEVDVGEIILRSTAQT
jgi:NADP-dependent 3-hydroxy acid dehydrogenase YdfG